MVDKKAIELLTQNNDRQNNNRKSGNIDAVVCVCIAIITMIWFGYWSLIGVDSHHDGIMLKPAMDVASGQMIFRDTFTQYGMLSVLIPACVLHFFGSLIALKLLVVCFYAGSGVLLYLIARKVMRIEFAWIPVFLMFILAPFYFWTFHPWSSVFALFFSLLLNYIIIFFLEKYFQQQEQSAFSPEIAESEKPEWGWLGIGILSMVPFWCRQPLGLTVPSVGILLILLHWMYQDSIGRTVKRLFYFITGTILAFFSVIIWLTMNHAVRDFALQSLQFAAKFASERTSSSVRVFYEINFPIDLFLFGFIFLLVFAWFFYLCGRIIVRKDMRPTDWYFLSVLLLSGAALHQYFPVACIRHLYWAAFPAFIVYARLIQAVWDSRLIKPAVWTIIVFLLATPVARLGIHLEYNPRVFNTWHKISELSDLQTYTHDGVLKNMRMLPQEKEYWDNLQTAIDSLPPEHANRYVMNLTLNGLPSLLFKNQKNWHPMYMNWPHVYPEFIFLQNKALETGEFLLIISIPRDNPDEYKKYDCFKKYKIWRSIPHWNYKSNTVIFVPNDSEKQESAALHKPNASAQNAQNTQDLKSKSQDVPQSSFTKETVK